MQFYTKIEKQLDLQVKKSLFRAAKTLSMVLQAFQE